MSMIFLKLVICSVLILPSFADISGSTITTKSIIKADDINNRFNAVNNSFASKGLIGKQFTPVVAGEAISKQTILDNFGMAKEIKLYPELGETVLSTELNGLFSSYISQIDSLTTVNNVWTVGRNVTKFMEPLDLPALPTDVTQKRTVLDTGTSYVSSVPTIGASPTGTGGTPSSITRNGMNTPTAVVDNIAKNSSGRYIYIKPADGININATQSVFQDSVNGNKYIHQTKIIPLKSYKIEQVESLVNGSDLIGDLNVIDDKLYFKARSIDGNNKLHRMNTAEEIVRISNSNNQGTDNVSSVIKYNDEIYFIGSNPYPRLYKIENDNAIQLTQLTGTGDSIANLTIFNNELFFSARNDFYSKTMKIDSTGSLRQAFILNTGAEGPNHFNVMGGSLYFASSNKDGNNKFFKLNSSNVVSQVSNIVGPTKNEIVEGATVSGSFVYFVVETGDQFGQKKKLFRVNSAGVTQKISNIYTTGTDFVTVSKDNFGITYNNAFYFIGSSNVGVSKLYKVDSAGTLTQISNTAGSSVADQPEELKVFNGELYFISNKDFNVKKIYKVKANDTVEIVMDIQGEQMSDQVSELTIFNNELFFRAGEPDNNYIKLFKYNPIENKITQVSNINSSGGDFNAKASFKEFNGKLYFSGGSSSYKLMRLSVEE